MPNSLKSPALPAQKWRKALYETVFESNTQMGRFFDIVLIGVIVASVVTVMLSSVQSLRLQYNEFFMYSELAITAIFTIEYVLRLICAPKIASDCSSKLGK
jgi:voltage-gated potassium channel